MYSYQRTCIYSYDITVLNNNNWQIIIKLSTYSSGVILKMFIRLDPIKKMSFRSIVFLKFTQYG